MERESVQENIEQSYKKVGSVCYSPKGRIYQISYAVEAAKHSNGVYFLRSFNGLVCIMSKIVAPSYEPERFQNPVESLLDSSYFDPENQVFVHFLGSKVELPKVYENLSTYIAERSQLVGPCFPGLHDYLLSCFVNYNSTKLTRHYVSGITYCLYVHNTSENFNKLTILRPNNKAERNTVAVEGNFSIDETGYIEEILKGLGLKNFYVENLEVFKNTDLKKSYDIVNIDFIKKEVKVL